MSQQNDLETPPRLQLTRLILSLGRRNPFTRRRRWAFRIFSPTVRDVAMSWRKPQGRILERFIV